MALEIYTVLLTTFQAKHLEASHETRMLLQTKPKHNSLMLPFQ